MTNPPQKFEAKRRRWRSGADEGNMEEKWGETDPKRRRRTGGDRIKKNLAGKTSTAAAGNSPAPSRRKQTSPETNSSECERMWEERERERERERDLENIEKMKSHVRFFVSESSKYCCGFLGKPHQYMMSLGSHSFQNIFVATILLRFWAEATPILLFSIFNSLFTWYIVAYR